ncbi:MAG: iron ABC transporter permease [Lentisphaeria bacterium]|nr:iron ABC transporter permease [Lentisphaeria bacterium]
MPRRFVSASTALLLGLFFLAFLFFPIAQVLRGGLIDAEGRPTFAFLREVFRNPLYLEGLRNSFLIASATTTLSLLLAVPLAWLADRYEFAGKRVLVAALLLPLVLPPFVGALGMQSILGYQGAGNALLRRLGLLQAGAGIDWFAGGFWGVVLMEALHLYPILYLNAVAAFANVDPQLLEAAADSGCVGFRRFRRIVLPLIMPGIYAGGTIVFIWSFTELGTPLMFHFQRVTPVQVFDGIKEIGDNPVPYALVLVMMTAAALLYLVARTTVGRRAYAMASKAGTAARSTPLRGLRALLAGSVFVCFGAVGILPHLGVIGLAFGRSWYRSILPTGLTLEHVDSALGHNLTVPSILNSVRYASLAVAVAMLLGVLTAWVIVRGKGRLGWLLDSLSMLPLAVPGLVLAFGYLAMTQEGRLFHVLDPVENPTVMLVIAYAIRRLPYVVRSAVAGLQQTSVSYEEAAASLGAGPLTCFGRITVPLISANLIAGGILAFSFSMLEVSDSLLLAQRAVYFPITKAIYELSMLLGQGPSLAAALGAWTMVFLGVSMLVASCLLGKRMGTLFRV